MRPYIGITGFMSRNEVKWAWDAFEKTRLSPDYKLMVGVLASLKTLYGHANKWPNRYPAVKDISGIFIQDATMLNLVHYNSKNTDMLFVQLMALTELIGVELFDGFQLNIAWPNELEILAYKAHYPGKKIVLQVGGDDFETIENSPEKLVERLMVYDVGLIDYVLLDTSGGKGKTLDPEKLKDYLAAIDKESDFHDMGVGVAGGLSWDTMHLLKPLLKQIPYLSIDAEGKLRNENDHLDMSLVEGYVRKAAEVFWVNILKNRKR